MTYLLYIYWFFINNDQKKKKKTQNKPKKQALKVWKIFQVIKIQSNSSHCGVLGIKKFYHSFTHILYNYPPGPQPPLLLWNPWKLLAKLPKAWLHSMQWPASACLSWPCWAQPPGAPRDAIFTAWKSYGPSRTSGSWPNNPFLHWSAAKPAASKGQAVEVAGVSWKSSRRSMWGTWKKILYIFSAS